VKVRGGTNRTSCGPFALIIDLGERKNPFSGSDIRAALFVYVEGLNEARTKLAAFFSILPLERPFSLQITAKAAHQIGTKCPTFRFLHVWIGKMFTNFPKAFLRLLIPLQPLGLL